jgi:hypothetical protein
VSEKYGEAMVSADYASEALLRYNFFPFQKNKKEEIPPCFTSDKLSPELAQVIEKLKDDRSNNGFDCLYFRATRFNNVSRIISIPHPKPYSHLVNFISQNWDKVRYILDNDNSRIKPREHPDGRLIIMDYEMSDIKTGRFIENSFAKKYLVKADIANCYPSIYSHALSWALVGYEESKKNIHKKTWYNEFDKKFRCLTRNETKGVPIGPATSNIACEIILSKVDEEMRNKKFLFHRFIDDYTCFVESRERAETFILLLNEHLEKYRLYLNANKTKIFQMPQPVSSDWLFALGMEIPEGKELSFRPICTFLDFALELFKKHPEGSVLKYAIKSIISRANDNAKPNLLRYLLNLSFHYPIIIPLIDKLLFDVTKLLDNKFTYELKILLNENLKQKRSDAMSWLIYYIISSGDTLDSDMVRRITETKDALAISTLLFDSIGTYEPELKDFFNNLPDSFHELDNYWLLNYELYRRNIIKKCVDNSFKVLKDHNINFIKSFGDEEAI